MSKYYHGFEAVIGLEIHAQLKTKTKIFSSDETNFDAGDNENISPVSFGMPGALPVLNKQAVLMAIKTGLALNCKINPVSVFARKNYFYPDLPKGYQISQYDAPICGEGFVTINLDGIEKNIRIERAHMEEDAGKSSHYGEYSLMNYNRAGVPLMEIVSRPDIRTPEEAAEYARTVRQILRYIDVCDGNLEEGSLRCDCNVSIRKAGDEKLGTKVEIKNINSFRFIEKAIEYEIERQIECFEKKEKIIQETRLYDPDKNKTYSMRTKEDAQDYRYFPDPDLLPLMIPQEAIIKIQSTITELPASRRKRWAQQYKLLEPEINSLTMERELADFFEEATKLCQNPKAVSGWILTELLRELNNARIPLEDSKIRPEHIGELVTLVDSGKISGKIAKTVFLELWSSGKSPKKIVEEQNLIQISDTKLLESVIDQVLQKNPTQVQEYLSGKTKIIGFFVGQIMKETKGQASPEVVNSILLKKLKEGK